MSICEGARINRIEIPVTMQLPEGPENRPKAVKLHMQTPEC